jgi:predicted HTH transcriptional regulator
MAGNEPIEPEPEPIEPATEKPTATPEPPSAAASAPAPVIVQTGILHTAREFLGKARIAIQDRKRKKRDKIMLALTTKSKITNDEVEKLLHVSDATAARYLSALVKENKIKQVGKTGTGVVYQKI